MKIVLTEIKTTTITSNVWVLEISAISLLKSLLLTIKNQKSTSQL